MAPDFFLSRDEGGKDVERGGVWGAKMLKSGGGWCTMASLGVQYSGEDTPEAVVRVCGRSLQLHRREEPAA